MAASIQIDSDKLRELREKASLSQEGLEEECRNRSGCSISLATIKRAESGKLISRRSAHRISKYFGVCVDDIVLKDSSNEASSNSCSRVECVALWLKSSHKSLIRDLVSKAFIFEPIMMHRLDNVVVIAFPHSWPSNLSVASLQTMLLTVCHSFPSYKALLTLASLTSENDSSWQVSVQQSIELKEKLFELSDSMIAISKELCCNGSEDLLYRPQSPVNGYRILETQHNQSHHDTKKYSLMYCFSGDQHL